MDMETGWKLLAVLTAGIGAVLDLRTHRIPNRYTVSAMGAALILRLVFSGLSGFVTGICGLAVGFVGILFWLSGALKAGDIKLYMAAGAFGGPLFCLNMEVSSILIGGAVSLVWLVFRKSGKQSLKRLWIYGKNLFLTRKFFRYEGDAESQMCFGPFLLAGAVAAWVWPVF